MPNTEEDLLRMIGMTKEELFVFLEHTMDATKKGIQECFHNLCISKDIPLTSMEAECALRKISGYKPLFHAA